MVWLLRKRRPSLAMAMRCPCGWVPLRFLSSPARKCRWRQFQLLRHSNSRGSMLLALMDELLLFMIQRFTDSQCRAI